MARLKERRVIPTTQWPSVELHPCSAIRVQPQRGDRRGDLAATYSQRLRANGRPGIIFVMKLQEIEQQALSLSDIERAELVLSLMRTLSEPLADVTDEEVFQRDAELETGRVEPVLHEEFVRRVLKDRTR
jgi:hypothetical protein